jgi:hypothetical protein
MILARIAEFLLYPSRSITVASEYDDGQKSGWGTLWRILVRSSPNVISAHQCNSNKPTDFDLVWSLQFHKTGIGSAALRIVDRPIVPASVAFLCKAGYEDKPDDRMAAFLWIRIINIGLFFPSAVFGSFKATILALSLPSLSNISKVPSWPFQNPIGDAGSVA